MDLEEFSKSELKYKKGLYIIQPAHQKTGFDNLYRVGRAGGNDLAGYNNDPSFSNAKGSNYASRAKMYLANWPWSGYVHAVLALDIRQAPQGYRTVAVSKNQVIDTSVPHLVKGDNLVVHYEKTLHRILDASHLISRYRGKREWFRVSDVNILKSALRLLNRGDFYSFKNNSIPIPITLKNTKSKIGDDYEEITIPLRRSSRIAGEDIDSLKDIGVELFRVPKNVSSSEIIKKITTRKSPRLLQQIK